MHFPERATTFARLRKQVVGIDAKIPLLDGTLRPYVFLDNAASTPTFQPVLDRMQEFMPWYSGVHRGMGYKAVIATEVYDQTRRIAGEFVGADLTKNVVLFGKNTTESINKLASHFPFGATDIVVTTAMEHHSNDLPWRKHCTVRHVGTLPDGSLDLEELRRVLRESAGKVRLVAVTGASNVTGICNPIHDIAAWTHEAGAQIFVDAAQLVAHRAVDMLPDGDPGHIDFLAYSSHKLYAPFGIGVLIGPAEFFLAGEPEYVGGGTVAYVGLDSVEWGNLPQREEAGSPNVVGSVALAEAIAVLRSVGMDAIADHEQRLLRYAIGKMRKLGGTRIYGPTENLSNKVGVLPFTVDGMDHALVATILSTEGGIGVRNGNFCAQPYMRKLLDVSPEDERKKRAARCDNPTLPGMVRASFGCYNNEEDIDRFMEMLAKIIRKEYSGSYSLHPLTGMYVAEGYDVTSDAQFGHFAALRTQPAGRVA